MQRLAHRVRCWARDRSPRLLVEPCSNLSTGVDPILWDQWSQALIENLPYKRADIATEDARSITSQLGYMPYNIIDVAARNDSGRPIVALLYGLTRGQTAATMPTKPLKPFPTIYWLTCTNLNNDISTLEYNGWIMKLQDRLNSDPAHIAAMQRAHEQYSEERRSNLSPEDLTFLENNKSLHEYHTYGVAGMKSTSFRCVKCLHCHYAHFMGNPDHGNIIGKWVSELLSGEVKAETAICPRVC